jgi:hypothetical protein
VVDNNASRMKVSTLPLLLLRCCNFDVRKRCGQGFSPDSIPGCLEKNPCTESCWSFTCCFTRMQRPILTCFSCLFRVQFTADKILPPTASQKDVFEACGRPFIDKFFEGYNGTIMACESRSYAPSSASCVSTSAHG